MSLYRAMELLASLICQNKPRNCCLFMLDVQEFM